MAFLAIIFMIVFLITRDLFPVFFIQETGGTLIRSVVIIIMILVFLSAGLILLRVHHKKDLKPLFYASVSMFLLALGFIGLIFSRSVGSPINWLGRSSHVLAGIYLFFFAISIFSESKYKKVSPAELLDLYFGGNIPNYRMVFENIKDSILLIHRKGNILGCNKAFFTLYKYGGPSQCPSNFEELGEQIEFYKLNGEKIPYERWSLNKALEEKLSPTRK
jgi:PAS domain-containing protein